MKFIKESTNNKTTVNNTLNKKTYKSNQKKNGDKIKSIAIMGGTFDPIHYGHLLCAEQVREELEIDKILFIPAGVPMHKKSAPISSTKDRFEMTKMAISNNKHFEISDIEIKRQGSTFTIDTIKELRKTIGNGVKMYFITGADAFYHVSEWRSSEELLKMCNFVVVSRTGHDKKELKSYIKKVKDANKCDIIHVEIPTIDISSTMIREKSHSDESIKYLTPECVVNYINGRKLYENYSNYLKLIKKANKLVIKNLSAKRYEHSLGTAKEAAKLAKLYGEDVDKAYLAGLFHDRAKEISGKEALYMCKKRNIELDPIVEENIYLAHGILAAELAKEELGISDIDILNAIKYHNTGRVNMSLLEKIIYIADAIEPNRKYPEAEIQRKLAYNNLDSAIIYNLEYVIKYNQEKKRALLSISILALNWLQDKEN